jgi:hypothetical protein
MEFWNLMLNNNHFPLKQKTKKVPQVVVKHPMDFPDTPFGLTASRPINPANRVLKIYHK